ncbi:UbiA family prenyltransferase [Antrihabitans spumae]|uniref:UbiA family prenyltransferase n=1 Tax=Antrihabitans spumae TaxID=3373370 RepID=A0ABW7KRE9_9NOCA
MASTTQATSTTRPSRKLLAYLQLGKARIYHHSYGWLLAILLLNLDGYLDRSSVVPLLLALLTLQLVQWSAGAADDIGGFRDGSDARNYAGRPAVTVAKKPLLTGALSEAEAVRFAVTMWVGAVVTAALAALTYDGPVSIALVLTFLIGHIWASQYSWGLKVSYVPLGLEATIFVITGFTALLPYWLIAGQLNAEILLVFTIFGLWFLMVVEYGNASDREGDAAVNRRTLAVVLSPRTYQVLLAALLVANIVLLAVLFTSTRIAAVGALAVLPLVALQLAQLYFGAIRQDWRRARFMGILSLDLGSIGLGVALLIS